MKECKVKKFVFNSSGMKLNIVCILFLIGGLIPNLNAQGIDFMHDLDKALEKAQVEDKLVFIDFYTSWCGPCKVLDKEVFSLDKAGAYFNENFINCKVQCDDEGVGVEIGKKYKVSAYPTLMFLNKNGDMVHSGVGSMSVESLIELAETAQNPEQNLMSFTNQWDAGNRDKAFVLTYFTALKKMYRNDKAVADFDTYFNSLSADEKVSKFNFDLATLIKISPFSIIFNYLEDHSTAYYKVVDQKDFDDFIAKSYLWSIKSIVNSGTLEEYETAMNKFKAKKYPYYTEYEMFYSAFLARKADKDYDIEEYMRRGTAFLAKYGENNDVYTISLTSLLGNLTGRANQSEAGIKWMETLLERNPNPEYLRTYFYILTRNYQFDKALKKANEIRVAAIEKNESTARIDKQIEDINKSLAWYLNRKKQ